MPTISVVVPIYNTEKYLPRCIDCILAQTFTDFELILVDDGSPDNSGAICDEYAAKDSRIYVIHQENQGVSAARNAGIDWVFANSDSQFISFIDSDDWVHPRFLELMHEAIERFHVNISQCRYMPTDGTKAVPEVKGAMKVITPAEHFKDYYSGSVADKLFARDCWKTIRFPVGQIYGEDVAAWYKILLAETQIALIDEVIYYYYHREGSAMRSDWTPKYISRINTWNKIIKDIKKHGDAELVEAALNIYCVIGYREYVALEKSKVLSKEERKKNRAILKRRFRQIMVRNKEQMKKNQLYKWYDKTAYSELRKFQNNIKEKLDWCYWTARGILEKPIRILKHLLKNYRKN